MSHILVVANETVDAPTLRDALAAHGDDLQVTVVSPVNEPKRGYVVYTDTRRASARRRLERALANLREAGISADGYVVEADPAAAVRDALAQLEPPVDEIPQVVGSPYEYGVPGAQHAVLAPSKAREMEEVPV